MRGKDKSASPPPQVDVEECEGRATRGRSPPTEEAQLGRAALPLSSLLEEACRTHYDIRCSTELGDGKFALRKKADSIGYPFLPMYCALQVGPPLFLAGETCRMGLRYG